MRFGQLVWLAMWLTRRPSGPIWVLDSLTWLREAQSWNFRAQKGGTSGYIWCIIESLTSACPLHLAHATGHCFPAIPWWKPSEDPSVACLIYLLPRWWSFTPVAGHHDPSVQAGEASVELFSSQGVDYCYWIIIIIIIIIIINANAHCYLWLSAQEDSSVPPSVSSCIPCTYHLSFTYLQHHPFGARHAAAYLKTTGSLATHQSDWRHATSNENHNLAFATAQNIFSASKVIVFATPNRLVIEIMTTQSQHFHQGWSTIPSDPQCGRVPSYCCCGPRMVRTLRPTGTGGFLVGWNWGLGWRLSIFWYWKWPI